ncbi:hypothetical protein EV360DRAFT_84920 [Lentinula raphanica]|nr:hypothetical protein EV360DRAFT_84920 [Lentinula raphanica]
MDITAQPDKGKKVIPKRRGRPPRKQKTTTTPVEQPGNQIQLAVDITSGPSLLVGALAGPEKAEESHVSDNGLKTRRRKLKVPATDVSSLEQATPSNLSTLLQAHAQEKPVQVAEASAPDRGGVLPSTTANPIPSKRGRKSKMTSMDASSSSSTAPNPSPNVHPNPRKRKLPNASDPIDVASETPTSGSTGDTITNGDSIPPPKKRGRKSKDGATNKSTSKSFDGPKLTNPENERALVSEEASRRSEGEKTRGKAKSKLPTPGNPIWKSIPVTYPSNKTTDKIPINATLRPRQWCSSKEELLYILPGLDATKRLDDYSTPVILIEGSNGMSISESKLSRNGMTVINLSVERDFVCVVSDLIPTTDVNSEINVTQTAASEPSPIEAVGHSESCEKNSPPVQQSFPPNLASSRAVHRKAVVTKQSQSHEPSAPELLTTPHNEEVETSIPMSEPNEVLSESSIANQAISFRTSPPLTDLREPNKTPTSQLARSANLSALEATGFVVSAPEIDRERSPSVPLIEVLGRMTQGRQKIEETVEKPTLDKPTGRRKSRTSAKGKRTLNTEMNVRGVVTRAQKKAMELILPVLVPDEGNEPTQPESSEHLPGIKREHGPNVSLSEVPERVTQKVERIDETSGLDKPARRRKTRKSAKANALMGPPTGAISTRPITRAQKKAAELSSERQQSTSNLPLYGPEETNDLPPLQRMASTQLRIDIPPPVTCSFSLDGPLSPLTPDDDISPTGETYSPCNTLVTVSQGMDNAPVCSSESLVEDAESPNKVSKEDVDIPKVVPKHKSPAVSSTIPSPDDDLPIKGWNDSLYHTDPKSILKGIKFTKKKQPLPDATAVETSTGADPIPTSGPNEKAMPGNYTDLEPGEIPENTNTCFDQVTPGVLPGQATGVQNVYSMLHPYHRWMATSTFSCPSPSNWKPGFVPSMALPMEACVTPSSSGLPHMSTTPLSVHSAAAPFASPTSYHSLPSTTFQHHMFPNQHPAHPSISFNTTDPTFEQRLADLFAHVRTPFPTPPSTSYRPELGFLSQGQPVREHQFLEEVEDPMSPNVTNSFRSLGKGLHFVPPAPPFHLAATSAEQDLSVAAETNTKLKKRETVNHVFSVPTSSSFAIVPSLPPSILTQRKRVKQRKTKKATASHSTQFPYISEEVPSPPDRTAGVGPVPIALGRFNPMTQSLCPPVPEASSSGLDVSNQPSPSSLRFTKSSSPVTSLSSWNVAFMSNYEQEPRAPSSSENTQPGLSVSTTLTSLISYQNIAESTEFAHPELDTSLQPSPLSVPTAPSSDARPLPSPFVASKKSGRGQKRKMAEAYGNDLTTPKRFCTPEKVPVTASMLNTCVPIEVPPDIQILIDAHSQNTPVLCITSRDEMVAYGGETVNRGLSSEFQYMYLGFFKVLFVKEERVFRPSSESAAGLLVSPDYAFGRIQWNFGLQWIDAGEDSLGLPSCLDLSKPWWHDGTHWQKSFDEVSLFGRSSSGNLTHQNSHEIVVEDVNESSPRFLKWHQAEARACGSALWNNRRISCPSIVSFVLLANDGSSNDRWSSSGWYCGSCGKLNRQNYLRRRRCDSSFCKDVPLTACIPLRLETIRFVGEQSPLVFPLNVMPAYIDPLVSEWDDGMRTMTYQLWSDKIIDCLLDDIEEVLRPAERIFSHSESVDHSSLAIKREIIENTPTEIANISNSTRSSRLLHLAQVCGMNELRQVIQEIEIKRRLVAKHVFTCNEARLQEEQTDLFNSIQEAVVLDRASLSPTPYFSYIVGHVAETSFAPEFIDANSIPVCWKNVPSCIHQARDLLQHIGASYGEIAPISIEQLVVLGWTSTGRKRGEHCLRAQERTVVIMALGHEIGIRIVPRSGFPATILRRKSTTTIEEADDLRFSRPPIAAQGELTSFWPSEAESGPTSDPASDPSSMEVDAQTGESETVMDQSSGLEPSSLQEDVNMTEASSELGVDAEYNEQVNIDTIQLADSSPMPNLSRNIPSVAIREEAVANEELSRPIFEEDLNGLIRMGSPYVQYDVAPGIEDGHRSTWQVGEIGAGIQECPSESSPKRRDSAKKKLVSGKEDMCFILVHGDVLLLSGDDFDYSIERKGMGLCK